MWKKKDLTNAGRKHDINTPKIRLFIFAFNGRWRLGRVVLLWFSFFIISPLFPQLFSFTFCLEKVQRGLLSELRDLWWGSTLRYWMRVSELLQDFTLTVHTRLACTTILRRIMTTNTTTTKTSPASLPGMWAAGWWCLVVRNPIWKWGSILKILFFFLFDIRNWN